MRRYFPHTVERPSDIQEAVRMELICFGFCDVRRSVFDLAHSFPQDGFRQPEQHPRRALRGGWTPGIRHLGHAHRFLPQSCRHRPELVASTAERLGEWPGGRLRHRPIERAQFVRCKSDLRIPLSIAQKLGTTQEATFAGNGVSSVPLVFSPLARRTTSAAEWSAPLETKFVRFWTRQEQDIVLSCPRHRARKGRSL